VGPYLIIEEIGSGGSARVYMAQKDGATDLCVLKQLRGSMRESDVAFRRFQREARFASLLDHPNIAKIIGAQVGKKDCWIAYELVPGRSLGDVLLRLKETNARMPFAVSIAIALDVLDALVYIHGLTDDEGQPLGVVHRDLSPDNIMLGFDGSIKLIDFGIARGNIDAFQTNPGTLLGTLAYSSPEQLMARGVDARSDLYSLSAVLYEMLSTKEVIDGVQMSNMLGALLLHTPRPVGEIERSIGVDLASAVMKGLAKRPDVRWQTASEMRGALIRASVSFGRAAPVEIGAVINGLFPGERERLTRLATAHSTAPRAESVRITRDDPFDDEAILFEDTTETSPA
jgi:serine/threonine protein kinase